MTSIVIAGSRGFTDYELLKMYMDRFVEYVDGPITVLSGTADGADKLGERWAEEHGFNVQQCPADWNDITHPDAVIRYRKDGTPYNAAAGPNRNEEMAKSADYVVCFWDGESSGTKSMINAGRKHGVPVKVVNYAELEENGIQLGLTSFFE